MNIEQLKAKIIYDGSGFTFESLVSIVVSTFLSEVVSVGVVSVFTFSMGDSFTFSVLGVSF